MFLLLACGLDKPPNDTNLTNDSRDTGDTDLPAAWEPPALECNLTDPRHVDAATLSSLTSLYGPNHRDVFMLSLDFNDYARDWGCPTAATGDGTETWSGACVTDGVSWEGRWTHTEAYGGDGNEYEAEEGDSVHYVDSYLSWYDVAFDGISAYTQDASGAASIDRHFRLDLRGYPFPERGGVWDVQTVETFVPGVSYTMHGRYDATPDEGEPGEYCLIAEAYPDTSCAEEPWGGWMLVGDATLVVTWTPQVCDGCGTATLDGVAIGEVCDKFLARVSPA
ncbi:MAG: hypothetical protein V4850_32810 [Myxococcota bacterium]